MLTREEVARRILLLPAHQQAPAAKLALEVYGAAPTDERAVVRGSGAVAPLSFEAFVEQQNPTLLRYEHVPRLVDVSQRMIDTYADPLTGGLADGWQEWQPAPGEPNYRRVLIVMPRRYFKSEIISRLLAPYFLYRFPELWVGITSYGAHLAQRLSRRARDRYRFAGGALRPDSQAVGLWETPDGGGTFAAGTGGPLLGAGYHFGISDDPIKPQDAASPTKQEEFEEWWPETFVSGEEPGATRWVIMQRLGALDPIDYLLRREVGEGTEPAPEAWHVVVCDEIKSGAPLWRSTGPQGLPPTCTLEPDPRPEGQILAPTRFSAAAVERKHRNLGSAVAATMMQQRPGAAKGDFWRGQWFGSFGSEAGDPLLELPESAEAGGCDWDTAYTKNEANSASAFVRSYRSRELDDLGRPIIYIVGFGFEWYEFPELLAWIRRTGGPHYIEEKASGKSAVQTLRGEKITVAEVPVVGGDKLARARAVQGLVESGRVRVHASVYRRLLNAERQGLLRVTIQALTAGGPDLDLNDAFVQALHRHTRTSQAAAVAIPIGIPNMNIFRI